MEIIALTDNQDVRNLKIALEKKQYLQRTLDSCFTTALVSENIELIKLILEHSPSKYLVEKVFLDFCYDGIKPEIIRELQQHVHVLTTSQMFRQKEKDKNIYLVDLLEDEKLKMSHKSILYQGKGSALFIQLKNQRKINDYFLDAFDSDHRLVMYRLLTHQYPLTPSQLTINQMFMKALRHNRFALADFLINPDIPMKKLTPDINAINDAFAMCLEEYLEEALCWLLTNKMVMPESSLLEHEYFNLSLRSHTLYQSGYSQLPVRRRNLFFNAMMRGGILRRDRDPSKYTEYAGIQPLLPLLASHIPPEAVTRTSRYLNALAERQERFRRSMRGGGSTDIHDYTRGEMNEEDDDNNENEDEGQALVAEGGEAVPMEGIEEAVAPAVPIVPPVVTIHPRKTLNESILEYLKHRITVDRPANHQNMSENDVIIFLTDQIRQTLEPRYQSSALSRIGALLTNETIEHFSIVITFLQTFYPEYIEIWMKGFLEESIQQQSCLAGAKERMITGLRGIQDAELNAIFARVEGPHLFRMFLRNCMNIFQGEYDHQCQNNVTQLIDMLQRKGGITKHSKEEEIKPVLNQYLYEEIIQCGIVAGSQEMKSAIQEAEAVIELIMDTYEITVLPFFPTATATDVTASSSSSSCAASE